MIEFKSAAAAEKEACQEKTNFVCVYALLSSHLDWTNLLGLLVHYGLGFSFGKGETS